MYTLWVFTHAPCGSMGLQTDFFSFSFPPPTLIEQYSFIPVLNSLIFTPIITFSNGYWLVIRIQNIPPNCVGLIYCWVVFRIKNTTSNFVV